MIKLIGEKTIDPLMLSFVKYFASLSIKPGDRNRNSSKGRARIQVLRDRFYAGLFYSPDWHIAAYSGKTYRVNGGHSSKMLLELPEADFPKHLKARVTEWHCDTVHELAVLFDQFDSRASVRTEGDQVSAHKAIEEGGDGPPNVTITRAISGISYQLSNDGKSPLIRGDAKVGLMHEFWPFCLWAAPFFRDDRFNRVGVAAAMFATHSHATEDAFEFWDMVSKENNPDRDHPTRVLSVFLRESLRDDERARRSKCVKYNSRTYYVKCLHAWNAWRVNRDTDLKYYPNSPVPKIL